MASCTCMLGNDMPSVSTAIMGCPEHKDFSPHEAIMAQYAKATINLTQLTTDLAAAIGVAPGATADEVVLALRFAIKHGLTHSTSETSAKVAAMLESDRADPQ